MNPQTARIIGLVALACGVLLTRFGPVDTALWAKALTVVFLGAALGLIIYSFVAGRRARRTGSANPPS